jgi:hypothetical protein
MITTSPFLHRVSRGAGFPGFNGTTRCSESRPSFPPYFVSFAWRYHLSAGQFAPADGQAPSLPQAGTRWSPGRPWSGVFRWRRPGLPGSWGTPTHVPCSQTPTGPRRQATTTPRCSLPPFVRRRLPRLGSYGAQSHGPCPGAPGLSTLRRMDYSTTTQDSLLAVGQTLPGGTGYPQGPYERFPYVSQHDILLPQAFLAQTKQSHLRPITCKAGAAPIPQN